MGDCKTHDEGAHDDVEVLGSFVGVQPIASEHEGLKLLEYHSGNCQTDVTDHKEDGQARHLARSAAAQRVEQNSCEQ